MKEKVKKVEVRIIAVILAIVFSVFGFTGLMPAIANDQGAEQSTVETKPAEDESAVNEKAEKVEKSEEKETAGENEKAEEKAEEKDSSGEKSEEKPGKKEKAKEKKNAKALRKAPEKVSEIYLNGSKGDDSKDGTSPENAVKTFGKARELAKDNQDIKTIWVTGTVNVSGDVTLEGTNASIKRDSGYGGNLLRVSRGNDETRFHDITIDGNKDNLSASVKYVYSLIDINGGKALIENGTVLENNKVFSSSGQTSSGGAVTVDSGSDVTMSGGVIKNNSANWGGGVYVNTADFHMSGGEIRDNHAYVNYREDEGHGSGGGILVWNGASSGSVVDISGDALIENNKADQRGGGISLSALYASNSLITLNMNGGTINGNSAGCAGGGIFVQAGMDKDKKSIANISGGRITNNRMDGSGYGNKAFGGGGIYVNGVKYGDWAYGELQLTNAIITDNYAKQTGGGYAACPISHTNIDINEGLALYGNDNGLKNLSKGADAFILRMMGGGYGLHGGNPQYSFSRRMLGGVPNNWINGNKGYLPYNQYKGELTEEEETLDLYTESVGNELTKKLGKVIISGNYSATKGGGIGSNGEVHIGTDNEKTSVSVEKKWVEGKYAEVPESVQVELLANIGDGEEYVIQTVYLNRDSKWKTTFEDLPVKAGGYDLTYSVREKPVDGYTAEVTGSEKDGFVITNTPVEKTEVSVKKVWDDKNNAEGIRPEEIIVKLLADGKDTGKTITLNKANGWKGTFTNLLKKENDRDIVYTVREDEVKGYTSEISGDAEKGFVITNRHEVVPPKKDETPKTGDNENPGIYLVTLGGSAALVYYAYLARKRDKAQG